MRIPGLKRLKQGGRWVRSRLVHGGLILGYHRVAEPTGDPYSIGVSPQHFAEQLDVLCQCATSMRLPDMIQGMLNGSLPSRAVALTFDDGYEDQLSTAKPLLERHQIPATVFVTTGYLGGAFWWNDLEEVLFGPANLPPHLSISISGEQFNWSCRTATPSRRSGDSRRDLLLSLYHRMLVLSWQQQQCLLTQLREWAGADYCPRQSKALSHDQVVQLASGDFVEIGAHSVSHPLLNTLPVASQQFEIQRSKADLEELLGHRISGFSYPNGVASEQTRSIVQEAGFAFACASYNDVVWRGSNRFYLPRFWIGDWNAEAFSQWLQWWLPSRTDG